MTFLKFTAIFSFAGFLFPILIRIIWIFVEKSKDIDFIFIFQQITFLLWPTFLMVLPASQDPRTEIQFFLLSLCANVIFYSIFGMLFWLGWRKHFAYFFIAGVPLVLIWWWLLNL